MTESAEVIRSKFWEEIEERDNPFVAASCLCAGYDVYGDLLGRASFIEYLYLLFRHDRPTTAHARLLDGIAVILANPGPRDHSVRAAMNAGAGGSGNAAALMAALAVGAGSLGGAREVALAVERWETCGQDLSLWGESLGQLPRHERVDVWPEIEHQPGFDPNGTLCPTPVRQSLAYLAGQGSAGAEWLQVNREQLENAAGRPLAMTGVVAAAFHDLGFSAREAEVLHLLLRLPGAAVHALEQQDYGWRRYPFFGDGLKLTDDPGSNE